MRFPLLRVAIQFENDISLARQRLQKLAGLAGLSMADRTRMVTALSEIARNAFQYAGEGVVEVFVADREDGQFLEVVVKDKGPGIEALPQVMEGSYESRTGMGLGITGAKRLVDRFEIESNQGDGTTVTLGKRLPPGKAVTTRRVREWTEILAREAPKDVYELLQMHNQELVGMMEQLRAKERELDSQLKRAEALNVELQASNQKLADEVDHRRRVEAELVDARDAAESAARAKAQFLANMSHEIRTPMNAVIGITRLLAEEPLGPQQREFVQMIQGSGEALLAVINDILDFSKIEAGKLELERVPVDVRSCVESAVLLLAPRAAEKGLELVYDVDPGVPRLILSDVTRLRQILFNLLGNAVKFTPEGEVEASVRGCPTQNADEWELRFAIRDTGIGIPPERVAAVFEAFSQADSSTTRIFEGTGLGLTISRRLCEMMGGRIWAYSTGVPGEGTTFSFTIRVPEAPPTAAPGLPAVDVGPLEVLQGRSVLVVEDNVAAQAAMVNRLQAWGALAVGVGSAREVIERLEREVPDLILLDWHLPDLAGDALAGRLRSDARFHDLPIVLLKPFTSKERAPSEQHVSAAVTKPCAGRALRQAVRRALTGGAASPEDRLTDGGFDPELGHVHPLRLLLAEDNRINQRVALLTLERLGYVADVAENGEEVMAAIAGVPYDAIFMDVHMPVMDGLEATRQVVASAPPEARPRIIAMTASVLEEERDRCFEAGMDDWVSKPIQLDELVAALQRTPQRADVPPETRAVGATPAGATAASGGSLAPGAPPASDALAPPPAAAPMDTSHGAAPAAECLEDLGFEPRTLQAYEDSLGGGDLGKELVLDLIRMYREDAPGNLTRIDEAIRAGDPSALDSAAHALKGSSANLGAIGVADFCFALERLGKSGSTAGATELFVEVQAAYVSLLGLLDAEEARRS